MTSFVLDTDILSLWQDGNTHVGGNILAHNPHDLSVTIISIEEQFLGWHTLLRRQTNPSDIANTYLRFSAMVEFVARLRVLTFSEKSIQRYLQLSSLKLNIAKMDLRIAAIALEENRVLVTRNRRDFSRIADLQIVDWSST